MSLRINDIAPDFTAQTTQGTINFHAWLDGAWGCSSRIPRISRRSAPPNWAGWRNWRRSIPRRGVKVLGLSVDPVDKHALWANDIAETQGAMPQFPMIGDPTLAVAKLYDMLPATAGDSA